MSAPADAIVVGYRRGSTVAVRACRIIAHHTHHTSPECTGLRNCQLPPGAL